MLEFARQKQGRTEDLEHLAFIEADTMQLPFADNTFQAVTVAFGIRT